MLPTRANPFHVQAIEYPMRRRLFPQSNGPGAGGTENASSLDSLPGVICGSEDPANGSCACNRRSGRTSAGDDELSPERLNDLATLIDRLTDNDGNTAIRL